MRAIVFGGSGFIGSHIVEELLRNNHCVINYDQVPSCIEHKVYDGRYIYIKGDIRYLNTSEQNLGTLFDSKPPDIVFILSAMANIEECENDPVLAMDTNVTSLAAILENVVAIKDREEYKIEKSHFGKAKIPKVVFASSMYAVSADHPYGISKMAGERLLKWYAKKYGFSYVIFRYGTVYGPRAGNDNSIKKLIINSLKNKRVVHYATGNERREYIHVRDAAKSTVLLGCSRVNQTVVITGNDSVTGERLCKMVTEILRDELDSNIIFYNRGKPDGHYLITPYRYNNDRVIKYVPNETVDFGHGLLEVAEEVNNRDE
uniref:Putative NADH dehydrogenase n=1 Tax=viral metagenome TaxID=1070528 RepID=A0A6M3JI25_9ZZZZ